MYLQHANQHAVYKLKYFSPDLDAVHPREPYLNLRDIELEDDMNLHGLSPTPRKRRNMKSFLEADSNTFARIRKRLSTLSLDTDYRKGGQESPLNAPPSKDFRHPPRRVNSLGSKDLSDRRQLQSKQRVTSRSSFHSDDKEYRKKGISIGTSRNKASEIIGLEKLNDNILTPQKNPEMFSKHIKLRDKEADKFSRSTSPKSFRSNDSSGKVHLGLIESLDLNERLNDVEKIKARYSNDEFMNSLSLYKLRGHDRCFHPEGLTEHVRRGTILEPPEPPRVSSKLTWESGYAIDEFTSPRDSVFSKTDWGVEAKHKTDVKPAGTNLHNSLEITPSKRKKSVEFDMEIKQMPENCVPKTPSTAAESAGKEKELKSILKRSKRDKTAQKSGERDIGNDNDDFLRNDSYRWKFHLPKIHSPIQNRRTQPSNSFKRKMYHFGDGVSKEFEQVINTYGNCRQNSVIREKSFTKDRSFVKESSKV